MVGAAYCGSDSNADAPACFASHPAYCSSTSYADRKACSGARPAYCENVTYANTRACAGSGKPGTDQVIEAAQRSGHPVDVGLLMQRLMS